MASKKRKAILLGLIVPVCLMAACVEDVDPPQITQPDGGVHQALDPPIAVVGDRRINLDWEPSEDAVLNYRLYRDEGAGSQETLIAETAATYWSDEGLVNGRLYRYRVTANYGEGLEGPRSDWTLAEPGVFSVVINDGALATADADVVLRCGAPAGSAWMRLGESQDLSGEAWRPFAATSSWLLLGSDGEQRVYAEFRDALDNRSEPVGDSILLDREAIVSDFRFEAWSQGGAGTRVLFFLLPAEDGGQAWAEVEGLAEVTLFAGGHGDTLTGQWIVSEVADTVQARVTGRFRDLLGNESLPFTAPDLLVLYP